MLSNTLGEVPVIGGWFLPDLGHAHLLPYVCAALCAREQFRRTAPPWAPLLPLRDEDCDELVNDDDRRLNLVGYYCSSMRHAEWDYQQHPPFAVFASGLLAYPSTPGPIRNDRELQREFPPLRLKGLCDGRPHWRSPATIAWDREYQARCAAWDARMGV
jgi:hypothetical protein